jgi:flotillin
MFFWHVPAPNEALLISGSKSRNADIQFRIVTGHGTLVIPVKQKARILLVGRVFAGHLRSIIGGLTVEQIIRERDRVAQEIKDGSHAEMEKLGIVVDALEIQEIEDGSGYINNLAAQAMKAQYERDLALKRAGFQAETEQADAQAYQQRTLAEAARDQAKYTADAEAYRRKVIADAAAYAERTTAQAQAEANKARAASLADGNQELIAASQIVESLPAMVTAAAQGISSSNLTILNGSEGLGEVIAGVVGQGLSILDTLRKSVPAP